jgi:Arc/MetJ-type ribon-helix-helix transcriptional regulator
MIDTHVRLTEQQLEKLRELADAEQKSVAELVREGVDALLSAQTQLTAQQSLDASISNGRLRSGIGDASVQQARRMPAIFHE